MYRKLRATLLTLAVATTVSGLAHAALMTGFFRISHLSVDGTASTYQVFPDPALPNNTTTNPNMCADGNSRYVIAPSLAADARELINKTLMGALLSGKRVSLVVSGTTCSGAARTGFPVYSGVKIEAGE